jgi:predicted RNA-binding Zn ribbon-like protein
MRKTQTAPGELELVREFVNTLDIEQGTDDFDSADSLAVWLADHELAEADVRVTRADLRRATEVREALRAALFAHTAGTPPPADAAATLDDAACRAQLCLRFDDRGSASLQSSRGGVDGALGRLLAIVHSSIAAGTWQRLKACREHTCEWAFYDHTKNRSGTWCTMDVCGNRAKARAYRARARGTRELISAPQPAPGIRNRTSAPQPAPDTRNRT